VEAVKWAGKLGRDATWWLGTNAALGARDFVSDKIDRKIDDLRGARQEWQGPERRRQTKIRNASPGEIIYSLADEVSHDPQALTAQDRVERMLELSLLDTQIRGRLGADPEVPPPELTRNVLIYAGVDPPQADWLILAGSFSASKKPALRHS
jgi:hypothetical protein